MTHLTITAKGQVTLRKEVLAHLGVAPGDKVAVTLLPGGRVEVAPSPKGRIDAVFGALRGKTQERLTDAQLRALAAEGWTGASKP